MEDYRAIKTICEENQKISSTVIDEFLLYYAASQNKLEREMNLHFAEYKHVTRDFQKEWINRLKSQYIAHTIFKKDGSIRKLLNHVELQRLNAIEKNFLELQAKYAWKFSFSVINENPAEDFYYMSDVFSGQKFLLYSPGVSKILMEQTPLVWFNLIGYNGECWQSFGPIGAYKSFVADDIFFFATEINPAIENEEEVLVDIENNPMPYMMLLSGSNYPLTFHKEDRVVQVMAEYDLNAMNTKGLTKDFITEYNDGVYRLKLKGWNEQPHFSQAYFDENNNTLLLIALTDRGFSALVVALNSYGYDFSDKPFLRVDPAMVLTAGDILKKKIVLNEYEGMFSVTPSEESKEDLSKLNELMALVIPEINAGRKPDVEVLAKKVGVDIETARELIQQIMGKFDDMLGGTK